jgi:N-acetylmuramoyl-L-alanine amidase
VIKVAVSAGGATTEKTLTVRREPPPPPRYSGKAIEPDSVRPDKDVALLPGDELEVACRGTAGKVAEFRVGAGPWQRLPEEADRKGQPSGVYRATIVATHTNEAAPAPVEVRIGGDRATAKGKVAYWSPGIVRQAVVARDIGTDLVWGLHEVRLGGPAVGRMPPGTVLRVTGQRGKSWRVQLTPSLEAWAEAEHVKMLPNNAAVMRQTFSTLQVKADTAGDKVEIPWDAHVPFAAYAAVAPSGRPAVDVDLYGAQHAATWISHHRDLTVIHEVTVEQRATDHVRVRVELEGPRLWGFRVEPGAGSLTLIVRGPPKLAPAPATPLQGLAIAVEAGHGGSNEGALGLAKVHEKDVTIAIAQMLEAELTAAGAKVFAVRHGDEFISMEDRAKRAMDANVDLFVSIHCNASDTDRGFLKVGGNSTYYKHPMGRDLARELIDEVLHETGLSDFGCVGNFNYYPIRAITWMPAALVETAFLSNPEEEAKLLDDAFRHSMAKAVKRGVERFLEQVRAGK